MSTCSALVQHVRRLIRNGEASTLGELRGNCSGDRTSPELSRPLTVLMPTLWPLPWDKEKTADGPEACKSPAEYLGYPEKHPEYPEDPVAPYSSKTNVVGCVQWADAPGSRIKKAFPCSSTLL